ncbi:MAG: type VII secretion protein EccB [Micromonosporaceae bacterium]|nr:type VII secretion protein EccB [Micromonosporaceae bacterium]
MGHYILLRWLVLRGPRQPLNRDRWEVVQSRREQVQAQRYLIGRMIGALVNAQPDASEPPTRRGWFGLVCGILVGALIVAGFTVYGLLFPGGSTAWRAEGALIVEKETGNRYLYRNGQLRPVLNYASALLLLGGDLTVTTVSGASLDGTKHGQPVGIIGAPDALPDASKVNADAWLVCQATASSASLTLGAAAGGRSLTANEAVLVEVENGTDYVLWAGHRMRVTATWVTRVLGLDHAGAVALPLAVVEALPAGPDLGSTRVDGLGSAGPTVAGAKTRIGQVFQVLGANGSKDYYQLRRNGLAPLTATQAVLALGDPATAAAYPGTAPTAIALDITALGAATITDPDDGGLPASPPSTVAPAEGERLCLAHAPSARTVASVIDPVAPEPGGTVSVPADRGAVVVAGGQYFLVTDVGTRFPVATSDDLKYLGYDPSSAMEVPVGFLKRMPAGPLLGRSQATVTVTATVEAPATARASASASASRAASASASRPSVSGGQADRGSSIG